MKNEFFNPDECPFEVVGFFEELLDADTKMVLGFRSVPEPTRPLGSAGAIEFDLVETVTLKRGMKEVTVKASPQRPRKVIGMLQILCGKSKGMK